MNVGDYVRTKKYGIKKILDIGEYLGMKQYLIDENGAYTIDSSIIKSSDKPIDLIKEGDLVNNHIVGQVLYESQTIDKIRYLDLEGVNILVSNDDIKSIVTHEQFESIEYRIGE